MRARISLAIGVGALGLAGLAPAPARGGAWTQPAGAGQMIATIYGWSGQGAPWGGGPGASENRIEAQTAFEYGLCDSLTLFGEISAEHYALSAPTPDVYNGLDYSGLGLRARLWSDDASVISAEVSGYVPGARDASQSAQAGDTGGEAEARALAGHDFAIGSMPAFVDAEVAFRLRAAGPPDEWHGDLTLGLRPAASVMALLQSFNTVSAGPGEPGFPAWRSASLQASLVYAIDAHWSVQAGVFATIATVNTNSERGALVALWRKF